MNDRLGSSWRRHVALASLLATLGVQGVNAGTCEGDACTEIVIRQQHGKCLAVHNEGSRPVRFVPSKAAATSATTIEAGWSVFPVSNGQCLASFPYDFTATYENAAPAVLKKSGRRVRI